jgi:transposase
MRDITGIKISVGSVSSLEKEMTEALKQPVAEAKESVKQSPRVNNDATGWYNNGKRQYAFISVTPDVVTYDITSQHNADVVMQILGPTWPGRVITSDRHTIYSVIPPEHRQICNSHTDRDFHKMADRGGASKSIGEQGTAIEQRMFHEWHRFKAGEINRDQLEKEFAPIEADLKKLLTEGIACCQQQHNKKDVCTHHKTNRTSKNMLELLPAFCTFAHQEGVEPTNNLAEQAARILVIKRKLSFGSKSEDGNRYIEAMMTTAATLAKQGRHLLTFLVAAVTALLTGGQAPSLLRPPSSSEQAWELQPPPSGTDPMPKAFEVLVEDSRPPPLETAIRIKKAAA